MPTSSRPDITISSGQDWIDIYNLIPSDRYKALIIQNKSTPTAIVWVGNSFPVNQNGYLVYTAREAYITAGNQNVWIKGSGIIGLQVADE